jgi:DNA polymerase III epsilon subunit family exonuclease
MVSSAAHSPLIQTAVRPTGGLVDRALLLLERGPVATEELAAEILALRGNPRAAAAAVFALLGSDDRVRVDSRGVWSLAEPRRSAGESLSAQGWAVVDVETTGGSPDQGHRVIEIGIVRVVEGRITERYSTLVDPGRRIPGMITGITGITNEMVAGAPRFHEVAPRIADEIGGRVFVGHNATFDWRFVSAELERCMGVRLDGPRLCTLRLARKLLPHLPSRSLGALASYFGIAVESHHRALDDAEATAELLLHFLSALGDQGVNDWAGLQSFFTGPPRPRRRRTAMPRPAEGI